MSSWLESKAPAQVFALVFGAVYLVVGVIGFFVGDTFIVFGVNTLHDILHVLLGVVLLAGSRTPETARTVNLVVGVVLVIVAALGFVGLLDADGIIDINANAPDHALHLVTGVLGLYFGTAGARTRAATA